MLISKDKKRFSTMARLLCMCLFVMLLCGCDINGATIVGSVGIDPFEDNGEVDESSEPLPTPEVFSYVDAQGNRYEALVDQRVERVVYDWNYLIHKKGSDKIKFNDKNYSIIKGVDVSHHNGTIDWKKVKKQGYKFAILRIGYRGYGQSGTLMVDKQFQTSFKAARKAGMKHGVYFFSQAIGEEEAIEEAELTLRELNNSKLDLPVVYDPELITNDNARTDGVTGEQFTKNTIAFCERIKKAGYKPMVYSNLYWEATLFDLYELRDYPIWYADYQAVPQTPYRFEFWQYSESGNVDGITGGTDLDVMFVKE